MIVYVGRSYTSSRTGTAVRHVKCEKCGCDYCYRLFRRGSGAASSRYGLDNKGAQTRAENVAAKKLQKLLLYGVDPVPCPDCGYFQAEMVEEYQSRFHGWLYGLAMTFGILLGVAAVLWLCISTKGFERAMNQDDTVVLIVMCGLLVAGIFGPILLRKLLIRTKNPNKNYPNRPDPIPGAPKAFRPGEEGVLDALPMEGEAASGQQLAYQNAPPEIEPGGWVTVQIALWPVPRVCCSCLQETQPVKQYTARGQLKFPLRVCSTCAQRYRWRSVLLVTIPIVLLAASGAISMLMQPKVDAGMPLALGLCGGIAGLIIGLILAARLGRPLRFSRFNGPLNTIRVRFKNSDYLPIFMEAAPPAAPTVLSPITQDDDEYNPSARPGQA